MISSKKYVADEVPRYIVDLPASPRMDGMDCTPWYFPSRPIWVRGHSRIQESYIPPAAPGGTTCGYVDAWAKIAVIHTSNNN